jgi:hypothetical protein
MTAKLRDKKGIYERGVIEMKGSIDERKDRAKEICNAEERKKEGGERNNDKTDI